MIVKKERSNYTVRFDLGDILYVLNVEDIFINFIQLFIEQKFNLSLILYYKKDKNISDKVNIFLKNHSELLNQLKNYKISLLDTEFVWYDIFHSSNIRERNSYKFRNVYSNENEFVQSVFTFITFIKGIQNREEENSNESRHDRKQSIRKKITHKESDMGIKEKIK